MNTGLRVAVGLIILTLACPLVWAADPAIVFVDKARAGAKAIMVMDADGTNRREIFRTGKQFCDCFGPSLSPSISHDGEWVAYIKFDADWAVYKISVAGGEPMKLLCGEGPDHSIMSSTSQWSPNGTEIAVQIHDYVEETQSIVILPADGIVCGTATDAIYTTDYNSPPLWWEIYDGVAWNEDGSQIAVLEVALVELVDYLTILDRSGDVVARYPVEWPQGFVGGNVEMQLYGLDWHRSGNLVFAFNSRSESTTPAEIVWSLTIANGVAVATELAEGHSPTWSPDDSQLLFGGPQGLTKVTLGGGTEFLGSGYDPDWRRADVECVEDTDCGTGYICCGGTCVEPRCDSDLSCEESPPDVCTDDTCDPCTGCSHVFDPGNDPTCAVDCSLFTDKRSCNAEASCRWDNRNKVCVPI